MTLHFRCSSLRYKDGGRRERLEPLGRIAPAFLVFIACGASPGGSAPSDDLPAGDSHSASPDERARKGDRDAGLSTDAQATPPVRGPQYGVPQACRSDGWCWELPRSGGEAIHAVWGVAPNDVWFAGEAGQIGHFDGYETRAVPTAFPNTLLALSGTATDDAWAGGDGVLLHFDGSTWRQADALRSESIVALHVGANGHGWAVSRNVPTIRGPAFGKLYELVAGKLQARTTPSVEWRDLSGTKEAVVAVGSCGEVVWGEGGTLDLASVVADAGTCSGARYRSVSLGAVGVAYAVTDSLETYRLEIGRAAVKLPELPAPQAPFVVALDTRITAGARGPVVMRTETSNGNSVFHPALVSVLYTLDGGTWKRGQHVPVAFTPRTSNRSFAFVGQSLFVTSNAGGALRIENENIQVAAGLGLLEEFAGTIPARAGAPALAVGNDRTIIERSASGTWSVKEHYRPQVAVPYTATVQAWRRPDGTLVVFTDEAWLRRPTGGAWQPFGPALSPLRPSGGLFVSADGKAWVGTPYAGLNVVDASGQHTMPFAEWPGNLRLCVEDESRAWAWESSVSKGAVYRYEGGGWMLAAQPKNVRGMSCASGRNAWLYRSVEFDGTGQWGDELLHWENGTFVAHPVVPRSFLVDTFHAGPGDSAMVRIAMGDSVYADYRFSSGAWSEVPAGTMPTGPTWQIAGRKDADSWVTAGYGAGAILYHP